MAKSKSDKARDETSGDDKKKGKKGKKGKAAAEGGVSVAAHPRAAAQVRRAKGLGGIAVFFITAYLSHKAGVPVDQVALRALAGGVAGYMLAWACSVAVWRHLVLAELRAALESGRATMQPAPADTAEAPTELQPAGAGAQ